MTSGTSVRPASKADLEGMAEALTLAFHDDPVFQWLFGANPTRAPRYSQLYFHHEGARHLRHDHVFTADGTPGAAFWDPPGHWRTSLADVARIAPLMLRGIGRRIPNALRGLRRMEAAHAKHPEHYYLAVLGTRPDRQGSGLGSAFLEPVLRRCDDEGIGAYLESSKEANIPFYRRHGFEVVGEVEFPSGPKVWPMWRNPRDPRAVE